MPLNLPARKSHQTPLTLPVVVVYMAQEVVEALVIPSQCPVEGCSVALCYNFVINRNKVINI